MGWTDSDTVKKHLIDLDRHPTQYKDVPVAINDSGFGQLPHRGIESDTDVVKRIAAVEPTGQSGVTLTDEIWADLTYDKIIPNQMVVADDDGLQQIYLADVDYVVDWTDGKVRRISGGAISNGAVVQVYYQRYQALIRNTDYTIDIATGEISVKSGGSLEPNSTVHVDYQLSAASGVDNLVSEAITEAEDKILSRIKDEYDATSTDQGLITGATELTLAIICRSLATRALSDGSPSAEGRARAWRELAAQCQTDALVTLRPFLDNPAMRPGDKKSNTSWEWM